MILAGVLGLVLAGGVIGFLVWFRGDVGGVRVKSQPAPEVLKKMPREETPGAEAKDRAESLPLPRVEE
jgi:hypothetical protein